MAVPKRKTTPSRSGKRRSHLKVSPKNIIEDKKSGITKVAREKANLSKICAPTTNLSNICPPTI